MEAAAVIVLAIALDLMFGDPPDRFHPVAWLGRVIGFVMRCMPRGNKTQFLFGMAAVLVITGLTGFAVFASVVWIRELPWPAALVLTAVLLKCTFSLKGLAGAAKVVKYRLLDKNDGEALVELRALVSRDTHGLTAGQTVSAVVESVAENSCDSFIAPLFYFGIFGISGAAAYRVINTFDAMIGYHGKWEYAGKFAAKLDDAVNYIPARITALLLVLSAVLCRKNGRGSRICLQRDRRRTESPNAGWTMSAVAGALDIKLEKTGHYVLNAGAAVPEIRHIDGAISLLYCAGLQWSVLLISVLVIYYAVQ